MDQVVRLLFHELADLPRAERERIFAERQIAPELRAEVESLLGFDSAKAQSFTECVSQAAEEALTSDEGRELSYCGPYRLARLLGSGGMGAVYLGERSDGEIRQQVADHLALGRNQSGVTTLTDGQSRNIIGHLPMKKALAIGAREAEAPSKTQINHSGRFAQCRMFSEEVAVALRNILMIHLDEPCAQSLMKILQHTGRLPVNAVTWKAD